MRVTPHGPLARAHQWAVIGIFLGVAIVAVDYAQTIAVPLVGAFLLGLLFGPLQARLERWRVPPALAALSIVASLGLLIFGTLRAFLIPLESWVDQLPELWVALRRQLDEMRDVLLAVRDATEAVQESAGLDAAPDAVTVQAPELLGGLAIGVPSVLAQLILCVTVLYFFLATRTRLRTALLSLCFDRKMRLKTARVIQDSERVISTYLGVVAAINLALAIVASLAFSLIGLDNAIFWGVMAGLVNFVPYLGPAVLTILLVGVGLVQDVEGLAILLPAATFFGINFIEANFVTPSVLGRHMTIQPMLVVISIGFWLWLWGPIGALVAVPILLVAQAMIYRIIR